MGPDFVKEYILVSYHIWKSFSVTSKINKKKGSLYYSAHDLNKEAVGWK